MEGNFTNDLITKKEKTSFELEAEYQALQIAFEQSSRTRQLRLEEEALLESQSAKILAPASPSPRKKRSIVVVESNSRRSTSGFERDLAKREANVFIQPSHYPIVKKPKLEDDDYAHLRTVQRPSNFRASLTSATEDRLKKEKTKTNISNRTTDFNSRALVPTFDSSRASEPAMSSKKIKPEPTSKRTAPVSSSEYALSHTKSSKGKGKEVERRRLREDEPLNEFELEAEEEDGLDIIDAPIGPKKRNKDGTLIVHLVPGPIDHKPPSNDPNFDKIEPNSGIRLRHRTRQISHSLLQEHLTDRYHLTPALVYTLLKPGPTPGSLDVDVVGDFIIIGVLAWKDEVRFMNGGALKDDVKVEKVVKKWEGVKGTGEENEEAVEEEEEEVDETFRKATKKVKQKRYLRFSLVDLSTEVAAASGYGILNIMLFEADSETMVTDGEGSSIPSYKGGSGGAYEKFWKETTGAVVAILNPSILKNRPVPGRPNIVTITPNSAESMMVIGRARDLGSCEQVNYGASKPCGSWVDTRVDHRCEYHVANAIKRTGARRAETMSANSSLSSTSTFNSKKFSETFKPGSVSNARGSQAPCDRDNKKGLLPRSNISVVEGSTIYVNAGSSTMTRRGGGNSTSISTTVGMSANAMRAAALQSGNGSGGYIQGLRDGPTVKDSKRAQKERVLEKELRKIGLEKLVKVDKGKTVGGQYIVAADKLRRELSEKNGKGSTEVEKGKEEERSRKEKKRRKNRSDEDNSDEDVEEEEDIKRKRPFPTAAVRLIGYDPSLSADSERDEDEFTKKSRLDAISSLSNPTDRAPAKLGAPPGPKIRSGVLIPKEILALEREKEKEREKELAEFRRRSRRVEEKSEDEDFGEGVRDDDSNSDDDLVVEGGPSQND